MLCCVCRRWCSLYAAVDRHGAEASAPLCGKCHTAFVAFCGVCVNTVVQARGQVRFVLPCEGGGEGDSTSGMPRVSIAVAPSIERLALNDWHAHRARCKARRIHREVSADSDSRSSASSEISSEMSSTHTSEAEAEGGSSESGDTEGEPAAPRQMFQDDDEWGRAHGLDWLVADVLAVDARDAHARAHC